MSHSWLPPVDPRPRLNRLDADELLSRGRAQPTYRILDLHVLRDAGYTIVDGNQAARAQDSRGFNRLLRGQNGRHITDRLAPTETRAIDRQECRVKRPELPADAPPVPVPERIPAVEDT